MAIPYDIISFVDMDEFEVQLYQKQQDYRHYRGTPCVVADSTGRIVSVSHEAKSFGVSRSIRLEEARARCNILNVIEKPNIYDKPDARTSRHGSWEVLDVLEEYCSLGRNVVLEYSPSDGFYIDCTQEINARANDYYYVNIAPNVYIEGGNYGTGKIFKNQVDDLHIFQLMCGAAYISELSRNLFKKTEIQCSAGISSNRLVAKMACPLHKPAGITIIPLCNFDSVTERISLSEITGFGKEKGDFVKAMLGIENLQQLQEVSLPRLKKRIPDPHMALNLYQGSRGICNEPVVQRDPNKAVSSSKSFFGPNRNMDVQALLWNLKNRADEMEERLKEEKDRHNRVTTSLQIQVELVGNNGSQMKRRNTFNISPEPNHITHEQIPQQALRIIQNFEGISFIPFAVITKITLSASKWTSVASPFHVYPVDRLDLGSEAEVELNKLDSSFILSPADIQINFDTPEAHTIPTATNESGYSVMEDQEEENILSKVYQLRISLDEIDPRIWRVIQVAEDITFYELHKTIENAIGWDWCMGHEFCTGLMTLQGELVTVGMPNKFFDGIKFICPEKKTPMTTFLGAVGDEVIYHHDFEEEWPHTVTVEDILAAVRGRDYPCCIDGKRAAPPEDSNKLSYEDLLLQFKDPKAVKEYHKDGLYLNYDPDKFNPEDVVFNEVVVSSDDEEE